MRNSNKKTDEIIEKIEVEKEILATMPKNNKKNIGKYLEKIEQLQKEYTSFFNKVTKEMIKRYESIMNLKSDDKIEKANTELKRIDEILLILNETKTSYEKMGLDKIIYKIDKYYKGNLEDINEQIDNAIQKFEDVGIKLKLSDFNYSSYVYQYMKVFFEEKNKGDTKSKKLKEKFEEVYWKCSDIIIHIELNLRNIYRINQSKIDKYFEKEKKNILKQYGKTREEIKKLYDKIKTKRDEKYREDKKNLLDKFLTGECNPKDFEDEKIKSNYAKLFKEESDMDSQEFQKGILELLNSLYEYKNYLKFEFIINDIKKLYQEKEKYKNSYKESIKRLENLEKQMGKINKRIARRNMFLKTKEGVKQTSEHKKIIVDIKSVYKEMEQNKFYNKIFLTLKEDSTIYELLELADSYYNYLTKIIIENNKTIPHEKIEKLIKELNEFLKNPYNNLINNITISEEIDIAIIIKDRYKLLNFNIDKEDFSAKNVDNLINILESIIIDYNLKINNINIQDVEEIIELKQTLESLNEK